MAELIDRQAFMEKLLRQCVTDDVYGMGISRGFEVAENIAKRMPYIEVVRCKECNYYGDKEYCPALCLADYANPDDFCCWGERKSSDD